MVESTEKGQRRNKLMISKYSTIAGIFITVGTNGISLVYFIKILDSRMDHLMPLKPMMVRCQKKPLLKRF